MLPLNIDDVIKTLDTIIRESINEKQAHGFFAALYQRVTIRVKEGIESGRFGDGQRMEKLDVLFANRYLEAYQQMRAGKKPTLSWALAFRAAESNDLLIIQHLMLGMNAHINLDLGIAAAQAAPPEGIAQLSGDFLQINHILIEMIDEIQENISSVSPLFGILDLLGKSGDEKFAGFSLKAARTFAWEVAKIMAACPPDEWENSLVKLDAKVEKFGSLITRPGRFFRLLIKITKWFEGKNTAKQIGALARATL